MRSVALLCLLAAAACGHDRPCPVYPTVPPRPLMWRVSAPAGSLVILGTHQATTPNDVPEHAWAELARASVYITEAREPDGVRDANYDWRNVTQSNRSLRARIGAQAFDRLSYYLDVTPDQLIGLRPWVAFMLLGRDAFPVEGPTMNEALYARATELAMPIDPLDTWEEQLAYLDTAITPDKLRAAIEDYEHLACGLRFAGSLA